MNRSRIFIITSLLLLAGKVSACWYPDPQSVDNMIYRLMEDVSPYYMYTSNHSLLYSTDIETENENLSLWRKQTGTDLSNEKLRWYVYTATENELKQKKTEAASIFGADGYRLLCIAKETEDFRKYINDPWYYPCKNDKRIRSIESRLKEVKSYNGRYLSRYALQTIRIMIALQKYRDAVDYWERKSAIIGKDVIRDMAERHVARAYLFTGDTISAATIYARHGDLNSLLQCRIERDKVWEMVYEYQPDSPFFVHELQFLLSHLDNDYLDRYKDEYNYSEDLAVMEQKHIDAVIRLADRVIRERKARNLPMWYYAKAALLNITDHRTQALKVAREGEKVCHDGTFLSQSMRVLRIMIEAETCKYDQEYEARLLSDIKWMDQNGRKNMTGKVKGQYERELAHDWDGTPYYIDVTFANKYYWNDVMNRILVNVLSQRLKKEGHTVEALLYCNLGEFWIMKNVYGKAESPNSYGLYSTTNLSNALVAMTDSCSIHDMEKMYERLVRPVHGIDSLVVRYGKSDPDFWHDLIGTRYIAENRYDRAVKWLKDVSRKYQQGMSTWEYFDRDPFCYRIGWRTEKRHHLSDRYDYKLKFAKEMLELEHTIRKGKTADKRGEAMIRYGVGLRNQNEWCWTLTRYYDTSCSYYATKPDPGKDWEIFYDISDSKQMIDRGIATITSRELKARYLHTFVRNKEVMEHYSDTETARNLRAHCDLWRDYTTD